MVKHRLALPIFIEALFGLMADWKLELLQHYVRANPVITTGKSQSFHSHGRRWPVVGNLSSL